jgi:hypothetical protein
LVCSEGIPRGGWGVGRLGYQDSGDGRKRWGKRDKVIKIACNCYVGVVAETRPSQPKLPLSACGLKCDWQPMGCVQLSSRNYSENSPGEIRRAQRAIVDSSNRRNQRHEAALQINGDAACVSMADLRRLDESASSVLYNRKLARCSAGDHSNNRVSVWVM